MPNDKKKKKKQGPTHPIPDGLTILPTNRNDNTIPVKTRSDELFKINPVLVLIQGIKQWLEKHPKLEKAMATINIVGGVLQTGAGVAAGIWAIISISSLASSITMTASTAISAVATTMGSSSGMVIASLAFGAVAGIGMIVMGVMTHKKYQKRAKENSKNRLLTQDQTKTPQNVIKRPPKNT